MPRLYGAEQNPQTGLMHRPRTEPRLTAGRELKKHKIMAKGKKSTKRLTKNKISEMLQNLFLQNSDKTCCLELSCSLV